MARPQINAAIKEVLKHVIDELWGVDPDEITCKIFTRETKLGTDDVLVLSQEEK